MTARPGRIKASSRCRCRTPRDGVRPRSPPSAHALWGEIRDESLRARWTAAREDRALAAGRPGRPARALGGVGVARRTRSSTCRRRASGPRSAACSRWSRIPTLRAHLGADAARDRRRLRARGRAGLALGFALGLPRHVGEIYEPLLAALYAVPSVVWYPVADALLRPRRRVEDRLRRSCSGSSRSRSRSWPGSAQVNPQLVTVARVRRGRGDVVRQGDAAGDHCSRSWRAAHGAGADRHRRDRRRDPRLHGGDGLPDQPRLRPLPDRGLRGARAPDARAGRRSRRRRRPGRSAARGGGPRARRDRRPPPARSRRARSPRWSARGRSPRAPAGSTRCSCRRPRAVAPRRPGDRVGRPWAPRRHAGEDARRLRALRRARRGRGAR